MNIGQLERIIESTQGFPSLPTVIAQAFQVINDPDSSVKEVTEIISKDQAIASKLLKLVNSAYYGIGKRVATINQAISILGFDTVSNLLFGISIFDAFKVKEFDLYQFWQHAIATSHAAKFFAMQAKYNMPDKAAIVGLVHDIGKLLFMITIPSEYKQVKKLATSAVIADILAEYKILGLDHAQGGLLVAQKWGWPNFLAEALRYHHLPLKSTIDFQLTCFTYLGNLVSHAMFEPDMKLPVIDWSKMPVKQQHWDLCLKFLEQNKSQIDDFLRFVG